MIEEVISVLISVFSLGIAALNFIYQRFRANTEIEKKISCLEERTKSLENNTKFVNKDDYISDLTKIYERVKSLEVKNEVVWAAIEKAVVDFLHHPNNYKRDALLEKFKNKTITAEELESLKNLLTCEVIDKQNEKETLFASLLIARINSMLYDMGKVFSK